MRYKPSRESFIPKDATPIDTGGINAAVYLIDWPPNSSGESDWQAIGFAGKAQRPSFNFLFRSPEARQKHIDDFLAGRKRVDEARAARKAQIVQPHTLTVGAIMVASWGFDQTTVDFFEIVGVPSARYVLLRPIAQKTVDNSGAVDSMAEHVIAQPGAYIGPAKRHRVTASNAIRLTSYSSAYVWDGRPQYQSHYA